MKYYFIRRISNSEKPNFGVLNVEGARITEGEKKEIKKILNARYIRVKTRKRDFK